MNIYGVWASVGTTPEYSRAWIFGLPDAVRIDPASGEENVDR
jgi:hypothetical protein